MNLLHFGTVTEFLLALGGHVLIVQIDKNEI